MWDRVLECLGGGGNARLWAQKRSAVHDEGAESVLHSVATVLLANHIPDAVGNIPNIQNDLPSGAHHTGARASGILHPVP